VPQPQHIDAGWDSGWTPSPLPDEALTIAVEHMRWARRHGQTPASICRALYEVTGELMPRFPTEDDAVWALARTWARL